MSHVPTPGVDLAALNKQLMQAQREQTELKRQGKPTDSCQVEWLRARIKEHTP